MKPNFIVSNYRRMWNDDCKNKFIIEPYIYEELKNENLLNDFDNIKTVPYLRQNRRDLIDNADIVNKKYKQYYTLLSKGFNKIHNTDHKEIFWKKILGIFLIRYITFLYEMYQYCDKYFDPDKFLFNILSKDSFIVPNTNEDFLHNFRHTHLGQEQLFSIFIDTFYKGRENKQIINFVHSSNKTEKKSTALKWDKLSLSYYLSNKSKITFNRLLRLILQKFRKPEVGIMGSHFRSQFLDELAVRSRGKINEINWENFIPEYDVNNYNFEKRESLTKFLIKNNGSNDDFDRYFFSSIQYCLPKIYIENFQITYDHITNQLQNYPKLRFVTSEAWIGDTFMSFSLACMKNNGIQHINNEHNFISHIVLKTDIALIAELSDYFVTLGWYDKKIPNIIKGASLFDWGYDNKLNKKKDITVLFILYSAVVKAHQYKPSYQATAENGCRYNKFVKTFFINLSKASISKVFIRPLPEDINKRWIVSNQLSFLKSLPVKGYDDCEFSAKHMMSRSRLVIISLISTSWLEALIMNIPTIVFYNKATYFLQEKYQYYFDELIAVGIFQTDPNKAARFVEEISENPEDWWRNENVQKAKNNFLHNNIGDPSVLIDFLLILSKKAI
jgi:putative transferase (TIGR04331 family)